MDLSAILEYNMTEKESRAYKLALVWEQCSNKLFEDKSKITRLRKKGDPRKSYLFKCCYKAVERWSGVIPDDELKYFIFANLKVLKDGFSQQKYRVDPNCLIQEKAWYRWKVWNKQFEDTKKYATPDQLKVKNIPDPSVVIRELKETKEYLEDVFKKTPTVEDMKKAVESRSILRWLTFRKISPYFILLCSHIPNEGWGIDLSVYNCHIDDEVRTWYEVNFDIKENNGN